MYFAGDVDRTCARLYIWLPFYRRHTKLISFASLSIWSGYFVHWTRSRQRSRAYLWLRMRTSLPYNSHVCNRQSRLVATFYSGHWCSSILTLCLFYCVQINILSIISKLNFEFDEFLSLGRDGWGWWWNKGSGECYELSFWFLNQPCRIVQCPLHVTNHVISRRKLHAEKGDQAHAYSTHSINRLSARRAWQRWADDN